MRTHLITDWTWRATLVALAGASFYFFVSTIVSAVAFAHTGVVR